jgi:hypothetical protein
MPGLDRQERATRPLGVVGQLVHGSSLNDARQELHAVTDRFRAEYAGAYRDVEPILLSFKDRFLHRKSGRFCSFCSAPASSCC